MGTVVEFNRDLALRKYGTSGRKKEECLPLELKVGDTYDFLKKGQRIFDLTEPIPLRETQGEERLSEPLANVLILDATHFVAEEEEGKMYIYTGGRYTVKEVFNVKKKDAKSR